MLAEPSRSKALLASCRSEAEATQSPACLSQGRRQNTPAVLGGKDQIPSTACRNLELDRVRNWRSDHTPIIRTTITTRPARVYRPDRWAVPEPMVRGLSAGERWIRTSGSAYDANAGLRRKSAASAACRRRSSAGCRRWRSAQAQSEISEPSAYRARNRKFESISLQQTVWSLAGIRLSRSRSRAFPPVLRAGAASAVGRDAQSAATRANGR